MMRNVTFKYSPEYTFILPFEENFDKNAWHKWMTKNWQLAIYAGIVYLIMVFGGRRYMEKRQRYELRRPLFIWNASLAIFSIIGSLRTMPEFIHVLNNYGFHHSACNRSYADFNPISGFWGMCFVMSKIPEFIDTVFIILRKQKLIFLHWYHHLATATFLWYGYTDHSSTARWIIVMNYTVHAIMYSYYALRTLKIKVPTSVSMFITLTQIAQMVMGSVVFGYVFYVYCRRIPCDIGVNLVRVSFVVYLSYFVLFTNFFIQAYVNKEGRKQREAKLNNDQFKNGYKIDGLVTGRGNGLVYGLTNGKANGHSRGKAE